MFNFDVHDDIRLTHDAKIEKDEVRLSRYPLLVGEVLTRSLCAVSRWKSD